MRESEFHDWLRRELPPVKGVPVGFGDDAAVIDGGGRIAAASDILVEGVHFDRSTAKPGRIGAKAVNRNLSDMAAMGLEPRWLLVSAALPTGIADEDVKEIVRGMRAAAGLFGAVLVGGDTARSPGPLVLDVTVLGPVGRRRPLLRSGARPGHKILVTGTLGGSILGKHLDFEPRVREGLFLNGPHRAASMIDVSDGLARDLFRILDASDAGAVVNADRIPVADAAVDLAARTGKTPLDHALGDGEDFELLFTMPSAEAAALLDDGARFFPVTDIGEIIAAGKRVLVQAGRETPMKGVGFDHVF